MSLKNVVTSNILVIMIPILPTTTTKKKHTSRWIKLFMTPSQPVPGWSAYRLAPCERAKSPNLFGNLSSLIFNMRLSHKTLSSIVALESGIEPPLSYSLFFDIFKRVNKTILRHFLQKKSSLSFRSVHFSRAVESESTWTTRKIIFLHR